MTACSDDNFKRIVTNQHLKNLIVSKCGNFGVDDQYLHRYLPNSENSGVCLPFAINGHERKCCLVLYKIWV